MYLNDTLNGTYTATFYDMNDKYQEKFRILTGDYRKGQRQGNWKRFGFYKGDSIVNQYLFYINDKLFSRMEWQSSIREWIYNEYQNDVVMGKTVEYYPNSRRRAEGRRETQTNDISKKTLIFKTGIWVLYDTTSKIYASQLFHGNLWLDGLEESNYVDFYQNKKKKSEGRYLDVNIKDGLWRYWDTSGALITKEFYLAGTKISLVQDTVLTYSYKKYNVVSNYKKGVREGETKYTSGSGTVITMNHHLNVPQGNFFVSDTNSLISLSGSYLSGCKQGNFKFYKEGKLYKEQHYFEGSLKSEALFEP